MRVIATTVVRESTYGKQTTGYIYDIDWTAQQVLRRFPVPDPQHIVSDDNPRGGIRGGRGVASTRHGVLLANYDTIYRYDDDWNVLERISHPLFVGIHEIYWDDSHLWVTATGIDAVLRLALDGTVDVAWDPHAPDLARRLGLQNRPDPIDGSVDYRIREAPLIDECHINGVSFCAGDMIVNCGLRRKRPGSIVRMAQRGQTRVREALGVRERPRTSPSHFAPSMVARVRNGETEVLIELERAGKPMHNGQLLDPERLAVNMSSTNTFRVFRLADKAEIVSVPVAGTWLRGMHYLGDHRVMVGTAPAAVALIDLESQSVEQQLQLSDDPNEAIHGLTVDALVGER